MVFDLPDPGRHILETLGSCAIVGKYDALSTFVVRLRDCSESLLTRSIPDLHLYVFAVEVERLNFEIDADSDDV